MDTYTTGKNFHSGFKMPIRYGSGTAIPPEAGAGSHLGFYFFETGTGIIKIAGKKFSIISPSCLCLNETETPVLSSGEGLRIHTIYFHPGAINSRLDYKNIRSPDRESMLTGLLDLYWLTPFIERDKRYSGQIEVGPMTGRRILQLLRGVEEQLSGQADRFWPCRSRSFLLELLNLLVTIHTSRDGIEHVDLTNLEGDLERIILYLNSNYHQRISISQLTKTFHTNRTTLSESFQKSIGMTIMEYLTRIRMQIACMMLRDTTLPVVEIMGRTGYEDLTNFGRVFKRRTGHSPSQYRQSYRGGDLQPQ